MRVFSKASIDELSLDQIQDIIKLYFIPNENDNTNFIENLINDIYIFMYKESTNKNLKAILPKTTQNFYQNVTAYESKVKIDDVKNEMRAIKIVLNKIKQKVKKI